MQNDAVEAFPINILVWVFFGRLIGIWDPSSALTIWGKRPMFRNSCMDCLVSASVLRNFIKSFALRDKAVQNSSFTFIAVHRPIPKVSPTVLYEFPVANLQRATATRFSTEIAWRRIVFCRTSSGLTSVQKYLCSLWNARNTDDPGNDLQRAVRTKTVALDRPTWSYAYGDVCCFGVELPGLQHSVVSSASAETLIASAERNSFSFAKI